MAWYSKIIQKLTPVKSTKPFINIELATDDRAFYKKNKLSIYTGDDLLDKKQINILNQMMTDPTIEQCINTLKTIRMSTGWDIIPASQDQRDIEIADFVKWNLENIENSFDDDLREILGAVEFGISINELIWRVAEKGKYKGKIILGNIKSKNPAKFNILTDDFDNILDDGLVNISSFDYGKKYPAEKFVIYSFNKKYEIVFGTSRLRSLYELWFLKQRIIEAWGVYLEKFGMPLPTLKAPLQYYENDEARNKLLTILRQLRFDSGLVIPKEFEIEMTKVDSNSGNPFEQALNYIDEQITKTIMGQTLTSNAQSSSYALGKVHFDILTFYIEQLGRDVTDKAINKQIIKRLVDYNFSNIIDYPKFVFNPIMKDDIEKIIDKYYQGVQMGILKTNEDDEKRIREWLKLPIKKQDESLNATEIKLSEKNIFTGVRRRTLTSYEKVVNFSEIKDNIETSTSDYSIKLSKIIESAFEDVIKQIQSKKIIEDNNIKAIDDLRIKGKFLGDMKDVFSNMLNEVYNDAQKTAKSIISNKKKLLKAQVEIDIRKMKPAEVLKWFENKSYFMTQVERDNIFKIIKPILFQTIKDGKTIKEFIDLSKSKMEDYFKQGLVDEEEKYSSGRLETIVRTNVNEALNFGLRQYYEDPNLKGFVEAYQYSAIMDDRVRPNHAILDGRIFSGTNPVIEKITPPIGYNCRCTLIPIVKGEEWEESNLPANWKPDAGFER